ncbi:MAG: hypothetical protein K9M15_02245 [Candidatus Marinimicrobia bacterium]|nr:hypothetical protein [Candidatus Neomarinimicrobiota bacterium]
MENKNKKVILSIVGFVMLLAGLVAFYFSSADRFGNQPMYLYLMLSILLAVIIIGVVFAILVSKGKINQQGPDYRAFFIIGMSWIPIGFVLGNPGLWGAGVVFMIIGLTNKKKWKDAPKWKDLSPEQRNFKKWAMVVFGILILAGLGFWFLFSK